MVIQQWNPGDAAAVVPSWQRTWIQWTSGASNSRWIRHIYGYIPIALFKYLGVKGINMNKYHRWIINAIDIHPSETSKKKNNDNPPSPNVTSPYIAPAWPKTARPTGNFFSRSLVCSYIRWAKAAWRGHNIKQLNFKHVNDKKARCAQCMVSMVSCTDINQLVAVLALFLVTPISLSKLTASTCPFWVAMFRVIAPSMVLALLISAPASVSKRSISTWPLSSAKCNGLSLYQSWLCRCLPKPQSASEPLWDGSSPLQVAMVLFNRRSQLCRHLSSHNQQASNFKMAFLSCHVHRCCSIISCSFVDVCPSQHKPARCMVSLRHQWFCRHLPQPELASEPLQDGRIRLRCTMLWLHPLQLFSLYQCLPQL